MTEQAIAQDVIAWDRSHAKIRELPVGSELLIAFALGAGGWYAIIRIIEWIAS